MPSILRRTRIFLIVFFAFGGAVVSCKRPAGEIVVGSTLIEDIVCRVSSAGRPVHNLIPPGMCPAHFDMRPGDIDVLAHAKAFLIHPWQQGRPNIDGLIRAAGLPASRVRVVAIEDNWMVPPVQASAVEAIADILCEIDPANATAYRSRGAERTRAIDKVGRRMQQRLREAEVGALAVAANEMQAPFVEWAGFDVRATFGRPEALSVAQVERLIRQAQAEGVALVIDNLQSGDTKISDTLARDTGAIAVVLSNFPGGFDNTPTWEAALEENVNRLLDAIARWKRKHGGRHDSSLVEAKDHSPMA